MSEIIGAVGGAAVGATALGYGIKFLHTVIGPGAANLGEVYRDWQDYRLRNWLKIGEAAERLGAAEADGSVNLRVAQKALDDSTMLSDPVMQTYAAGILVGAKLEDGDDDEALPILGLLNELTRRETTTHYLLYSELHRAARSGVFNPKDWAKQEIALPTVPLSEALDIPTGDGSTVTSKVLRALSGLARQSLINSIHGYGSRLPDANIEVGPLDDFSSFARPTFQGLTLFAWAHGLKTGSAVALLSADLPDLQIPVLTGGSVRAR